MEQWLITNKDVLEALASVATIISLFYVFLAALASRKQSILKDAPIFILIYKNRKISIRNLNKKFAYNLHSEPFFHLSSEDNAFSLYRPGKHRFQLQFSGPNYMAPDDSIRELDLIIDGEKATADISHFLFSRLVERTTGLYLFYKDSHGYRFAMKVASAHDSSTINNGVVYKIVKPARYTPWYRIGFWAQYFLLRVCWPYAKIAVGQILIKLKAELCN